MMDLNRAEAKTMMQHQFREFQDTFFKKENEDTLRKGVVFCGGMLAQKLVEGGKAMGQIDVYFRDGGDLLRKFHKSLTKRDLRLKGEFTEDVPLLKTVTGCAFLGDKTRKLLYDMDVLGANVGRFRVHLHRSDADGPSEDITFVHEMVRYDPFSDRLYAKEASLNTQRYRVLMPRPTRFPLRDLAKVFDHLRAGWALEERDMLSLMLRTYRIFELGKNGLEFHLRTAGPCMAEQANRVAELSEREFRTETLSKAVMNDILNKS